MTLTLVDIKMDALIRVMNFLRPMDIVNVRQVRDTIYSLQVSANTLSEDM